jgi:hybrid cluster-associated redox disulfide protein
MSDDAVPAADMIVDDVMRRWPSTIRTFLDFKKRCVGCPIAAFHSIEEACDEHDVDADVFLPKILEAAKAAA